ncbi:MAG: hypothetical protein ACXWL2_02555 [Candidatus Chromulinivorax sp.]
MKYYQLFIIISCCFIAGLFLYAYQNEYIIVNFQKKQNLISDQNEQLDQKVIYNEHKLKIYFYKNEKWYKEETQLLWSSDITTNIIALINAWIAVVEEEKIIDTDIQLLSAIICPNKEVLLSFNKNIFFDQASTFTKLMIIHALLKTLQESKLPIQSIRFLVQHQILTDDHLNFTISWPINGYVNS